MSNEKKLAITSDIVFSLDTKIKGKDYVYEVEHLHASYQTGDITDYLSLKMKSKDKDSDFKTETINMAYFDNLKPEQHEDFKKKIKEFANEAYNRMEIDMQPVYEENMKNLRSLSFK
ncbi:MULTISPECIES: hypothetical protein [Enterobacterales]|uniref:hypothetical protein n=1 Tax=Enterobacterales TaxID=91347 RepID=UPI001278F4A2|nr:MULTISPECIES: hypothetical protein [Enterobacterales]EBM7880315.1 hypothetical protein [Salmonella enterica subsp. enterica serovar Dublin]EJS4820419.1 hypothetical protein [Salmonella enterica subsp. enterica serovar Ouakam]EKB1601851.1 hypothetical protein [Salmonella enterica subsp. enterica serovar Infantis]EMB4934951.1 hypothetical protein [Salmonella enterica]HAU6949964.1 hypothetical protein [Salmonella enterica subsp. enterica serovar Bredeney]